MEHESRDPTTLYFSKSIDDNNDFTYEIPIRTITEEIIWGGSIAIGPEGELYITWSESTNIRELVNPDDYSTFNPYTTINVEIFFVKSLSGGLYFSSPITVNTQQNGWQIAPSMTVDDHGHIYIGWISMNLDNITNYTESVTMGIRVSKSIDRGNTFKGDMILKDMPSIPMQLLTNIVTDKSGNIYLTWTEYEYMIWGPDVNLTDINADIYFLSGKLEDITIPYDYTPIAVGSVITISVIVSIIAVALTEVGKYGGSMLFLPLYTRLNKGEIMDNFLRGQIYGVVRENPGVNYNHIKNTVGVGNGVLTYHLRTLEREDFIHSKRKNSRTYFFPVKLPVRFADLEEKYPLGEEKKFEIMLSNTQNDIINLIRMENGISQRDITMKLDLSKQNVNYNIKRLVQMGHIITTKVRGEVLCYLMEQ
jgi:predicted transcriptional regulator